MQAVAIKQSILDNAIRDICNSAITISHSLHVGLQFIERELHFFFSNKHCWLQIINEMPLMHYSWNVLTSKLFSMQEFLEFGAFSNLTNSFLVTSSKCRQIYSGITGFPENTFFTFTLLFSFKPKLNYGTCTCTSLYTL